MTTSAHESRKARTNAGRMGRIGRALRGIEAEFDAMGKGDEFREASTRLRELIESMEKEAAG